MTVRFKRLNIALVAAFACSTVLGQGTAQISGRVTDATGALIPGADVQATQTDTGLTRNTVTNETGAYALPSLPRVRIGWKSRCPASRRSSRPASRWRSTATRKFRSCSR